MLERRAYSRRELVDRLVRKEFDEPVARECVGALVGAGLVDDRRLAESVVRLELERTPAGAGLLEAKLARRGIERGMASEVVREALRGRSARDDALTVARKRARALADGLSHEARWRRLMGALSRRGFGAEEAREAVDAVLGEGH